MLLSRLYHWLMVKKRHQLFAEHPGTAPDGQARPDCCVEELGLLRNHYFLLRPHPWLLTNQFRVCIFVAGASVAFAQAPPAFEVASIKRADPDHSIAISRSGNRITFSNYSVEMLIEWAYNIRRDRLLGKPKGLDTVRYDIVAAAPQETLVPGMLNRMMQSLLAERFKLAFHRETKELPYYAMVVDRNGPKVQVEEQTGPAGQNPFHMTAGGHLTGAKVSTDMLAKVLSDQLGRFVEDQTELRGVFDFTLDWAPDTNVQFGPGGPATPLAELRNGPSIFTVVKEQLGFRLDARRGEVEVVVIDGVENIPTAN